MSWKDWKSKLRTGTYDKYQTDTERKQKLPQYVKKEDWDRFVDIQSMPDYQAKRQCGKRARKEMKSPHTSGRKGQAHVAEELRKKFPDKEISRTDVFVETHTRKDGSATCEQLDKIKKTVLDDPSSAYNDLENDALAQVLGPDTRGRVRGLGLGVSRTSMQHTHPYRIALQEEQASRATMQTQIDKLKEMLEMRLAEEARQRKEDMEHFFTSFSQSRSQVQTPTDRGSSSQMRDNFSTQQHPITATHTGTSLCRLMHLTKRPASVVAYGRVKGDSPDDPGCYKIILDEIIEGNVDLVIGEGKTEDLITGDETEWPKWKTVFY
ncbi:bromodomain-containing protein 4-like protein isoform X3 [Cinnamomum micranthum f. kanehirae]|uniref:Bromodomain-containing protein 4-like protein isoform X3 n=1 Tax=Cinnamomum micranthum f. kanehirae TaxID=337451 RepID=A0A3S3NF38_9MAGN|nr:bromodomain-containing protein 4-like protein isoform X3 [Cinnamomum micranthum f. kanehirae]